MNPMGDVPLDLFFEASKEVKNKKILRRYICIVMRHICIMTVRI